MKRAPSQEPRILAVRCPVPRGQRAPTQSPSTALPPFFSVQVPLICARLQRLFHLYVVWHDFVPLCFSAALVWEIFVFLVSLLEWLYHSAFVV